MRGALILAMSLVAAIVPPMRQACASTCVQPSDHIVIETEPSSCHKAADEMTPERPAPAAPSGDDCSHDHTGTLKPGSRASIDPPAVVGNLQFVMCDLITDYKLQIADSALPVASPPIHSLPLRI